MSRLETIDYLDPAYGTFYDELSLWSAPFGLFLLEQVPLRTGIKVLDVGAGTGFLAIELAQRCGLDTTVHAVDPWEAAMNRLREKLDYFGIPNVHLQVADAAKLDLPDGSIDLIVSNLGINNFDNAPAVLAECFRVAKPGADLLLTTNLTGHMQEFYDEFRATLEELGMQDHFTEFDAHVRHRGTVDSVTSLLEGAGFDVRSVDTRSFRMRFVNGSALLRHHLIRVGFLKAWMDLVPEPMMERTFARLQERLDSLAAECGKLALTIPMACVAARRRDP